jgi:hypothetical protein
VSEAVFRKWAEKDSLIEPANPSICLNASNRQTVGLSIAVVEGMDS